MTGSGMMDCKKALTAVEGDIEKAIDWLREKGLATAQKKAGRIAAEGISFPLVTPDGKKAVVVEVNSETDFVAKNEKFQAYVSEVAAQALETAAATLEAFLAEPSKADPSKTVADANAAQISVIGENLKIRRFQQMIEEEGLIVAPETRTSSPVRITRNNDTLESVNTQGLFVLGEGAGYSGGIVTSAADGVRLAVRAKISK